MQAIETKAVSGDGMCIGGKHFRNQFTQHMINTELTLEQLQAMSGGMIDGDCWPPIKHGVMSNECKVSGSF